MKINEVQEYGFMKLLAGPQKCEQAGVQITLGSIPTCTGTQYTVCVVLSNERSYKGHTSVDMATSPTHLFVPVERVDDKLHHPVDLRLEGVFLCPIPHLFHLRHTQSIQFNGFLLSVGST